jgi:hypothetical protein
MIDVRGDSLFDLVLSSENDITTVTKGDAEQQAIRLGLTAYFNSMIGELDRPTILKKMEVQAERMAAQLGFIGQLNRIRVYRDTDIPDALYVELNYTDGSTETIGLN